MSQLEALLQLLSLERLPRTGWVLAGVPAPESIAAHSLGTALVVLGLAPRVAPPLEVDRAVALAVVHDTPEAWVTDLPPQAAELLPTGAKAKAEERAAEALLGPLSPTALERHEEYRAGESREARFVKLCDKLQLGIQLVDYLRRGARGLESFRPVLDRLDCSEFPPCAALRDELLRAYEEAVA